MRSDEPPLRYPVPLCPRCSYPLHWSVVHTDDNRHTEVWTCSNPHCNYETAVTAQSH